MLNPLQNQFFNLLRVAFGEIVNHNFWAGAGQNPNGGKEHSAVDFYARDVSIKHKLLGAANEFFDFKTHAFFAQMHLVAANGVFQRTGFEGFVHGLSNGNVYNFFGFKKRLVENFRQVKDTVFAA